MFSTNGKSWHLFTLSGHKVFVSPWFLVLIGLFSFAGVRAGGGMEVLTNALIWAPVLFIGLLFHEFAHAYAIQGFGYGSSQIMLHGFGGVTVNRRRGDSPPAKSVAISLAGPAASLLLGLIFVGVSLLTPVSLAAAQNPAASLWAQFVSAMAWVNIVWAIFNMLPINPLDGGHVVLHSLRGFLKDDRKAYRYSAISSLVVLGLGLVAALAMGFSGMSLLWLIFLAAMFGMQNWQILKATESRTPSPRF